MLERIRGRDDAAESTDDDEVVADGEAESLDAAENGVSEADAEAGIAALVEAERAREAEEAAVAEAEDAADRETPTRCGRG